jgi:hypothetical protein
MILLDCPSKQKKKIAKQAKPPVDVAEGEMKVLHRRDLCFDSSEPLVLLHQKEERNWKEGRPAEPKLSFRSHRTSTEFTNYTEVVYRRIQSIY